MPTAPDSPAAVTGVAVTVLASLWAGLRWVFWPRIQSTVRAEVRREIDEALTPLRREISEHVATMDRNIDRIADVLDKLSDRVRIQGERQAATAASVEILVDRRSGSDRRRGADD